MPVRRLQGEAIRDAILSMSGELDPTLFGKSVPVHVTSFMQGRGRPKKNGPLDGAGRRSLYLEVRRNFLMPMMLAFDTPIPFSTVGRRNVSNVPAQALILMNDPFVVEQAKRWADHLQIEGRPPKDVVHEMYLSAFARPPSELELQRSIDFLLRQAEALGDDTSVEAPQRAAWADLAHVLWNVKEFVYLK